jgi:hypothetical protein
MTRFGECKKAKDPAVWSSVQTVQQLANSCRADAIDVAVSNFR